MKEMIQSRRPRVALFAIVAILAVATTGTAQLSLTTTFASNNGSAGNMFDVVSLTGVIVTGFDINVDPGMHTIEVWTVTGGGGYLPALNNQPLWTLQATYPNIVSAGNDTPTPLPQNLTVTVPPGQTQGFYVTTQGTSINYTNGTAQGAVFVQDANMQITEGHGGAYPFNNTNVPRVFNGTCYYNVLSNQMDDMTLTQITAPVSNEGDCSPLTAGELVTVQVFNLGSNTVPGGVPMPISYTVTDINGSNTVNEMYTPAAPLAQFAADTFTFATPVDLSVGGAYTFDATVSLPGDMDTSNDSVTGYAVQSGDPVVSTFPFSENFDGLNWTGAPFNGTTDMPANWINVAGENSGITDPDWYGRNTGVTSFNTGPSEDHTTGTGYFVYADDSGNHPAVNLQTPCLDLGSITNPTLNFWVHSNNSQGVGGLNENTLHIDVITYPGAVVNASVATVGHLGDFWASTQVDLTAFSGQIARIQFRAQNDAGSTTHDIAIDDVFVFQPVVLTGQAPQPGLAVLDINAATNANAQTVASGGPGPYNATADANTPGGMSFTISGVANQPIILLAGPLTGGVFNAGPIGVLDVGTFIAAPPFFQVTTLADGLQPGVLNGFFNTGPSGTTQIDLGTPAFAAGFLTGFQCAVLNNSPIVASLSNAVGVTIN